MTKTSAQTADDDSIGFRGFYGEYKITLQTKGGRVYTFNVHLNEKEGDRVELRAITRAV